jgi:hypothetical protein
MKNDDLVAGERAELDESGALFGGEIIASSRENLWIPAVGAHTSSTVGMEQCPGEVNQRDSHVRQHPQTTTPRLSFRPSTSPTWK